MSKLPSAWCLRRPHWKPARVEELLFINGEQTAEAADFTEHTFSEGLMRQVLDALLVRLPRSMSTPASA